MFLALDTDPDEARRIVYVAFAALLAVKLVGYLMASKALAKAFPDGAPGSFAPALARTIIGALGGYLFIRLWGWLAPEQGYLTVLGFYFGIFVFRIVQWWLVLGFFYPGALREAKRGWAAAFFGTLWSFFLDVPAWLAFAFAIDRQIDPTLYGLSF